MNKSVQVQIAAWLLSITVAVIAFVAWGTSYGWLFGHLSLYIVFPLLGLLAFSLMWSHYIAAALRMHYKIDKSDLSTYFEATSALVLIAILLHPGLLIFQLYQDGRGLPPASYEHYVAAGLGWITFLGTISWAAFIAYEFRRLYDSKPWWKYVQYATDIAMFAIFYHALRLGGALHLDWFRIVWYFYGVTLVASMLYIYKDKLSNI